MAFFSSIAASALPISLAPFACSCGVAYRRMLVKRDLAEDQVAHPQVCITYPHGQSMHVGLQLAQLTAGPAATLLIIVARRAAGIAAGTSCSGNGQA